MSRGMPAKEATEMVLFELAMMKFDWRGLLFLIRVNPLATISVYVSCFRVHFSYVNICLALCLVREMIAALCVSYCSKLQS